MNPSPWTYSLTSHWDDPERTGRRCVQCGHAATHRARATHATSRATDDRWFCTNHCAAFCGEKGLDFLAIRSASAQPVTVTVTRP